MKKPASLVNEVAVLKEKLTVVNLPPELKQSLNLLVQRLNRMANSGEYSNEYERVAFYLDWVVNLPWQKRTDDLLDLEHAQKVLDKNHCGLQVVKERILEFLAVLKLRKEKEAEGISRAPILCFVGLVGTGKTTIASSIAEAIGRKFARIPFGGLSDPLELRGQSRSRPDAEPGLVIKALRRVNSKNPVILLDEIDRVATEGRSSLMGVLVELLDPEQNMAFRDHFLDFPFDLSEVLFITTCNNTTNIPIAVLDRLEPIQMPSYTDEEKITIGRDYILPANLKEAGLDQKMLKIDVAVWPKIVRPLGFDAGVRTLERTINGIVRKVAKMTVQGKGRTFQVTPANMKEFLPTW